MRPNVQHLLDFWAPRRLRARPETEGGMLPPLGCSGTHAASSCDLAKGICAVCISSKPPSSLHLKAWPAFSPTDGFYLVLAAFEDWCMSGPWQWPHWLAKPATGNEQDTHWHQHHSDHGPVDLVLSSSWQSRAILVNKWLSGTQPPCRPLCHPHWGLLSKHVSKYNFAMLYIFKILH